MRTFNKPILMAMGLGAVLVLAGNALADGTRRGHSYRSSVSARPGAQRLFANRAPMFQRGLAGRSVQRHFTVPQSRFGRPGFLAQPRFGPSCRRPAAPHPSFGRQHMQHGWRGGWHGHRVTRWRHRPCR